MQNTEFNNIFIRLFNSKKQKNIKAKQHKTDKQTHFKIKFTL